MVARLGSFPGLRGGAFFLRSRASFRGANGNRRRTVPPEIPPEGGGVSQGYGNDRADLPASVGVPVRHSFPHPWANGAGLSERWPVARPLGGPCLESQHPGRQETTRQAFDRASAAPNAEHPRVALSTSPHAELFGKLRSVGKPRRVHGRHPGGVANPLVLHPGVRSGYQRAAPFAA